MDPYAPKRNTDGTMNVIDPTRGGSVVSYNPMAQPPSVITPEKTSPTTTISSSTMSSDAPIVPATPENQVVIPPSPYNLTQDEQSTVANLSSAQKRVAELSGQVGEYAQKGFREAQEGQYGVSGKRGAVTSFQNQLSQLSNEYKGIQLQLQQTQQQQQEAARGQGITAGGLAPHLRASQTVAQQQLLSNAIKQYSVGAQLAAAQGDLASALDLVDRAVNAEFNPKLAKLEAEKANLEALKADPNLTSAERKRIAQIDAEQRKAEEKLATEKENKKTIQALALQAQQNGMPTAIVSQIANAKTVEEVLSMNLPAGALNKDTATSIQEYNFAVRNGYKGSFSQYQNEDANRKAAVAKAGAMISGLPSNVVTQIDKLSASFDSSPIVKNYNEVQNKKMSVDAILQSGIKGPADLAIVYEFMKALDPTSVVREAEYATASAAGNIFQGIYAKYNGYLKAGGGFLPENVRKEFQSIINKKLDIATKQYKNLQSEVGRKIDMKTGQKDGVDYLTNYEAAFGQVGTEQPESAFADIQTKLTLDPNDPNIVYIDRATWDSLGPRMDALLAEIAADGGKLLVK